MRVAEGEEGPYLAEQLVTRGSVPVLPIFATRYTLGPWYWGFWARRATTLLTFSVQPNTVTKRGPRMIRVIIDTVLFSCMAAMVSGVVIVAASFLI
jgi:hypothetical protein